jgi:hypothetical protein
MDTEGPMPDHHSILNGMGVMCMGDKSPKAKQRTKQQASANKQQQSALAKSKAPVSAVGAAKKK